MSISAYLVCPSRKLTLGIGKPLREPDGTIRKFAMGNETFPPNSEQLDLTKALWKFLADTAGEPLYVKFSGDEEFETIAGYPQVGGWAEDGDIPFEDYLRGWSG